MTKYNYLVKSEIMINDMGKSIWGLVKVSHSKSSSKINIPVDIAKETGIDKAKFVLIVKTGRNKIEVKKYDSPKDLKEYVQENKT